MNRISHGTAIVSALALFMAAWSVGSAGAASASQGGRSPLNTLGSVAAYDSHTPGIVRLHPLTSGVAYWNVGSSPDAIVNTNGNTFHLTESAGPTESVDGSNSLALTSGNGCLLLANSGGFWDSFSLDTNGNITAEVSSIASSGGPPIDIRASGNQAVGIVLGGPSTLLGFTVNSSTCALTQVSTLTASGGAVNGALNGTTYIYGNDSTSDNNVYACKVKNGKFGKKCKAHATALSGISGLAAVGGKKSAQYFTGQFVAGVPQAQALTSKFAQEPGSPQADGNSNAYGGAGVGVDSANNQLYQVENLSCFERGPNNQVANYSLSPFKYENGASVPDCDIGLDVVAGSGNTAGVAGYDGVFDIAFGTESGSGSSGYHVVATTQFSTGLALTH